MKTVYVDLDGAGAGPRTNAEPAAMRTLIVSPALRERLATLAEDSRSQVERCHASIMTIDGYAGLDALERRDVFAAVTMYVKLWYTLVLEQRWLTCEETDFLDASIRRRVHRGVPSASMMRACQVASHELWVASLSLPRLDAAVRDELLFVVSPYLLEYASCMSQLVNRVILDEQLEHTRSRRELRERLAQLVFDGAHDEQAFVRIGRQLDFDPAAPRIAIAIDLAAQRSGTACTEAGQSALAQDIARYLKSASSRLVHVIRSGRMIVWTPCAQPDAPLRSLRTLSDALDLFARHSKDVQAIGVGLPNHSLRGWTTSAAEATTALDFAPAGAAPARIFVYSDIVIDRSVRSDASALRYFDTVLDALLKEKDLIPTLRSYFDNSRHRKATAASLCIHPNTLNYRLNRIETLLGAKLDAPSWIARLFVALKLHDKTDA